MNIAVCDDYTEMTDTIYRLIKEYLQNITDRLYDIVPYYDGHSLLSDIQAGKKFDIIFLDIEMPSITGLEVAKQIRQNNFDVLIVFITSHPNFMSASFKVEAFDFLTKPLNTEELYSVLERCLQKYIQTHGQIKVRTPLGIAVIQLNDIMYIYSEKHYINFILNNDTTIRTLMTLDQLEAELTLYRQFARCHQSYIVNFDYVLEVQRTKILLKIHTDSEKEFIPVSRTYKESVKEKFLLYHLTLEMSLL